MSALKVLIVTSWYPTADRPVQGVFVWEQVRASIDEFDVAVIAPRLVTLRTAGRPLPSSDPELVGVPIRRPRVLSPIPGRPAYVAHRYATAVSKAYDDLAQSWGKPDVIHAHVVLNAGYAAAQLGTRLDVPVVLTEHATSGSTWLKAPPGFDLLRRTLRAIPLHVAVSPALADRIRAVEPVVVRVIGNIVDTELFRPIRQMSPSNPARFAFVGGLIPRKGADSVVRAIALARDRQGHRWIARIAGRGPERDRLSSLADDLGIGEQIELVGELPLTGIRDLYEWANAAVLPSSEETFGVAAAEAMAMGRPVIGYDNPGFRFVLGVAGGRLVPQGDVLGLMTAMQSVAEGTLGYDGALARESIVSRFGRAAFIDQLCELYADATAARWKDAEA
jgi:glycosyltransferase involved in cell wall biosynthesis